MTTRRRWTRGAILPIASALLIATTTLHAAEPQGAPPPADTAAADPQAQAAERKKAGDQAMDALRYADALAAYTDVYTITKDPALLYNMGRALQALNRFPEALVRLEAFDALASPDLKARVPRLPKLMAEIRARVSTLTILTNVAGARILVRDTVVGKAPLPEPLKLVAGPAEIEVEADGYFPGKQKVDLPGGSGLTVNLDLFSRSTTGLLAVKASATGAEVFVDGKRLGVAPVEVNVPRGEHRIVVRHPSFRVYETSAVVPAGGSKSVTAALEAPPVVTRWWFWTSVGVVVAAGVAVAVAAVSERSPDAGTIAPGQLHAASLRGGTPLLRF